MLPKYLELSAFGPYRSIQKVDFTKLNQGLFLICGDTGSGKTTIFDAICFALFGKASGDSRDTKMFRSDFAKPDEKTYVKLIFEHQNVEYTIIRNPEYYREAKNKSDKLVKENTTATISAPNGLIISKVTEVNSKVEEILGINALQFKQIFMIAQNDFLKLLYAESSERVSIFRKIFNTQIYEEIQNKLKEEYNLLNKQYEENITSVLELEQLIGESNSASFLNKYEITNYIADVRLFQENLTNQTEQYQKQLTTLQNKVKEIEEIKREKESNNQNLLRYQEQVQLKEKLNQQKEQIEQLSTNVKFAKIYYEQYIPCFERVNKYQVDLNQHRENYQLLEKEIKQLNEELTAKQIKFQEMSDYAEQIQQYFNEINLIKANLDKYERIDQIKVTNLTLGQIINNYPNQRKQLVNEIANLKKEINNKHQEAEQVIQKDRLLQSYKLRLHTVEDEIKTFNKARSVQAKIKELQKQHEDAQIIHQKSQSEKNQLQQTYQKMRDLYDNNQAGILASKLESNQPCPVCGSLDHPVLAENQNIDFTLDDIKQKAEQLEIANQKYHEINDNLASIFNQIKFQEELLQDFSLNWATILSDEEESINKKRILQEDIASLEQFLTENKNIDQAIIDLQNKCQEKEISLQEQEKEYQKKLATMESNLTIVNNLKTDLKYKNKLEAESIMQQNDLKIKQLQQQYDELKKLIDQILKQEQILKSKVVSEENLIAKLTELFQSEYQNCQNIQQEYTLDIDALQNFDLDQSEKILQDYQENVISNQTVLADLKTRLVSLEKIDLQVYLDQLNELKLKIDEQQAIYQTTMNQVHQIKTTNNRLEEKYQQMQSLKTKYENIRPLALTANGMLTKTEKIKFEIYVQSVYFDYVLQEANQRFALLSNQRYKLLRKKEATNLKSISGLELEILDNWTNQTRSVKSLSGGESFMASLSLALGLSDVMQQFCSGIKVDAMFIDEGFGTLDSETLHQAIELLKSLPTDDKILGIISHVSELKEEIDQKIIVQKSNYGSLIQQQ